MVSKNEGSSSYSPESFWARGLTMSEKKQPVDLGLLEEDDEFEEFPAEGRPLDLVDRDSGLRVEAVREKGPAGGRRGEVRAVLLGLEALLARSFTAGFGSECHGGIHLSSEAKCSVSSLGGATVVPQPKSGVVCPITLQLGYPPSRSYLHNLFSLYLLFSYFIICFSSLPLP